MPTLALDQLIAALLVVLLAGFFAGTFCKRLGISLLVGYLVVGAIIGEGGLGFVSQEHHELEYIARGGALLLLFSVGIEFSLEELRRLSRYFFVGGSVQMLLVMIPLTVICMGLGLTWRPALLIGAAGALSSTILVFKALAEWGQTATPHGRRAIGILLFQDVALVPLLLVIPLLTGVGDQANAWEIGLLIAKSIVFVMAVEMMRRAVGQWFVPLLAGLRSLELVVLFTLTCLGGSAWTAYELGLPPSVGALAAGLMLSGNRLSKQIDTLILPFRETFSALFFVTLGSLLHPGEFLNEPLLLSGGIIGMLLLKASAASVALKLTGLSWRAAAGMGIGLAQLGEFSFLLIAGGVAQGVVTAEDYNRVLFIALGTLIATPQLIKLGLRWTESDSLETHEATGVASQVEEPVRRALVVGVGPIGRQVASRMELVGVDVCLIDLSPVNLYAFAQQGFHTVAGDARDPEVLTRAGAAESRLAVISVPQDDVAVQVVRALREANASVPILVRCRFMMNVAPLRTAGANEVVSEEQEASGALLKRCEEVVTVMKQDGPANSVRSTAEI